MDAVINLKHEPKLREAFAYAHVHNNTVLIDRRTKWGNPFQDRPRRHARRSHRALPRRSLAPHPRGRDRAGGTRGTRRLLARLSLRSAALSRPCARTRSGMGLRGPGGAGRWVSGKWVCLRVGMAFMAMPSARAIRCNLRSLRSLRFPLLSLSPPVAGAPCALRLPGKRPRPRIDPEDVPSTTAEGGGAWNKQILLRRDGSLCHTCSLRQPRLRRGPPLRCAPLRPGLGMKRRRGA